jgi:hypothetical protein
MAGAICLLSAAIEVFLTAWDDIRPDCSPVDLMHDELIGFAFAAQKDLDFRMESLVMEHALADLSEERSSYRLAVGPRAQAAWLLRKIGSVVRGADLRHHGVAADRSRAAELLT